jgi:hypothetical protein
VRHAQGREVLVARSNRSETFPENGDWLAGLWPREFVLTSDGSTLQILRLQKHPEHLNLHGVLSLPSPFGRSPAWPWMRCIGSIIHRRKAAASRACSSKRPRTVHKMTKGKFAKRKSSRATTKPTSSHPTRRRGSDDDGHLLIPAPLWSLTGGRSQVEVETAGGSLRDALEGCSQHSRHPGPRADGARGDPPAR